VKRVLFALVAILGQLEAFLNNLLVLPGMMRDSLADSAFQLDHVILGHIFFLILK
jgi:hypothetical protein